MPEKKITAYQGKSFTITLRSAAGTNYSWCLTTLPKGVALASCETACPPNTGISGGPLDYVFTFFAITQGTVEVGFKLLCRSNPEEESREVLFDVTIIPHNEEDGLEGFIQYNANSATFNIPPYGYNGVSMPRVVYGHPDCAPSTIMKYGFPGCPIIPIVDYGFPGCVKYGFPGCP